MAMSTREYVAHDAMGLAQAVQRGDTTPGELLETALSLADAAQPALNALTVDFRDRARAQARDLSRAEGRARSVLAGVPFALKDLGAALAGTVTTCGSRLLRNAEDRVTSTLVQRYLDAGLVIFGRSASPEFGIHCETFSDLHGLTRNPWDLARTAGGSSGGAAALVASGVLPAAQGSDGGGSIRIPAALCGLVGLKPTRGRMPSGPMVGEGWSGLAGAHVLTRSMRDCAAFLDIAKGWEPAAPSSPENAHLTFLQSVGRMPKRALRIAVSEFGRGLCDTDPETAALLHATAQRLSDLGHDIVATDPTIDHDEVCEVFWKIVGVNLAAEIAAEAGVPHSSVGPGGLGGPGDMIEPATAACIDAARGLSAAEFIALMWRRDALCARFSAFFETFDILLSPVTPVPAWPVGALPYRGDWSDYAARMYRAIPYTPILNLAGLPGLALPLGATRSGLPIGLQLAAGFGREDLLLGLGGVLEAEAGPGGFNRTAPAFQQS
ncbi:MAG: amidase [Pseudomonadota bacterium]